MNWFAQSASAALPDGVQGSRDDSLPATFLASDSAADCRLPASKLPTTPGCRNGNALLLRSSDSLGTSPACSVVSPSRSRAVFRYSRAVSRRSGMTPAALGSPAAPVLPPVPPGLPAICPLQAATASAPRNRTRETRRVWGAAISGPGTEHLPAATVPGERELSFKSGWAGQKREVWHQPVLSKGAPPPRSSRQLPLP